jgi:Fe-S-cluster containining protein
LRIDPAQRFTCSQCGRCCRGFDVVVTPAEIALYRHRNAAAWFDAGGGAPSDDPFEPVPGAPGMQRIRKRADGACGFLSADNKCRIHQQLGAAHKPLTCRLFPFAFHTAADGIVVTASFNCPTIAANEGAAVNDGPARAALDSLRKEWLALHPAQPAALELVKGRSMTTRSLFVLRQQLAAMLSADGRDLRAGVRRIAAVLDDLTRSRVRALADDDFAEYLSLTVPHAAVKVDAPPARDAGRVARLLQYGFLYAVAAVRDDMAHPGQSRTRARARRVQLLAHFHGLGPGLDGVNVTALRRRRVDVNDDAIRPVAFHYLRSAIETLGSSGRPIVDELSLAASYLNAACALAAMHADAAGQLVDRAIFIQALTEAADVAHARHRILDAVLTHFSGDTNALLALGTKVGAAS